VSHALARTSTHELEINFTPKRVDAGDLDPDVVAEVELAAVAAAFDDVFFFVVGVRSGSAGKCYTLLIFGVRQGLVGCQSPSASLLRPLSYQVPQNFFGVGS
jgi:hypothetical protein